MLFEEPILQWLLQNGGFMDSQVFILNEKRNVTLTAYLQDDSQEFWRAKKRPAVVIFPGGAYAYCSDREADPVAQEYLRAGYYAFVLRYSVGWENAVWPNPLEDYDQAMELIAAHAKEWHLIPEKIAVIGFSAGGHLAACAATMAKHRPAAAILAYPVILEGLAAICAKGAPGADKAVDSQTCPCFIAATGTDTTVSAMNSLRFVEALYENGISAELHLYVFGPHGFSTARTSIADPAELCSRTLHWVEDSISWLEDVFGAFTSGEMSSPRCPGRVRKDKDPYLSVDCQLATIAGNQMAVERLKQLILVEETTQKWIAEQKENLLTSEMTLRSALQFLNVPGEVIRKADEILSEIPNRK